MDFYRYDPTNSVKALKEGTTHMQYDKITQKNKHKQKESRHSEYSETNPIQRSVTTSHLSVLMTVHNFSTQHSTEQF